MTRARDTADTQDNVGGSVPPFAAGKNKIINGDFNINQRSFSSSTTNGTYNFDRFYQSNSGGTVTASAQTFTVGTAPVSGYEARNFIRLVSASQSAAGDYAALTQTIESVRTFAGQTVTISFWAKASTGTPNVGVSIIQGFGTGGSPSSNVITSFGVQAISTSWARYSFTATLPSISGKTIGTGNDDKLQFNIWTSVGSTISGLGYPAVGVQNATIDLWGIQAEAGRVATPFQTATGTIQGELAACQRYYWRTSNRQAYSVIGIGPAESTTKASILVRTPVTMRVAPTSVDFATLALQSYGGQSVIAITSAILATSTQSSDGFSFYVTVASGLTAGVYYQMFNNNSDAGYIGVSAEL